jgi:hypothetical protein
MTQPALWRVTICAYRTGRRVEEAGFDHEPILAEMNALSALLIPGVYDVATDCLEEGRYVRRNVGLKTVADPEPLRRRCFYVPAEPYDENGWVPSLVFENLPRRIPLAGSGEFARPWYWGTSYEEASRVCERENEQTFGLTGAEAQGIIASSLAARR